MLEQPFDVNRCLIGYEWYQRWRFNYHS